ncbi:MAG: hypothetical protein GY928_08210 [Colwellia sp.]|nr:hypothetical protein [Colwellia sp.]
MAWTTPKTNYASTNGYGFADVNPTNANIYYLRESDKTINGTTLFSDTVTLKDDSYALMLLDRTDNASVSNIFSVNISTSNALDIVNLTGGNDPLFRYNTDSINSFKPLSVKDDEYGLFSLDRTQNAGVSNVFGFNISASNALDIVNVTSSNDILVRHETDNTTFYKSVNLSSTLTATGFGLFGDSETVKIDPDNNLLMLATGGATRYIKLSESGGDLGVITSGRTQLKANANVVFNADKTTTFYSDILISGAVTRYLSFPESGGDLAIVTSGRTVDTANANVIFHAAGKETTFNGAINSTTLNTGQGDNELYAMDQDVLTTSDMTVNDFTVNGNITSDLNVDGNINPTTSSTNETFEVTATSAIIPRGRYWLYNVSNKDVRVDMQSSTGAWDAVNTIPENSTGCNYVESDGINFRWSTVLGTATLRYRKF